MDADLDEIDGDSDREIVRKIYSKVCDLEVRQQDLSDKQDTLCRTQNDILQRMEQAESVTNPIREIADSTWNNLVYMLGWGVLAVVGLLVYYLMKAFGKL